MRCTAVAPENLLMRTSQFILHPSSFILFLFWLAACAPTPGPASDPAALPVAEPFRAFYEEMGGRAVFGDVLEPAFPAPDDGRLLQYFENLRLELEPDSGAVLVSALGAEIAPDVNNMPVPEDAEAIQAAFNAFYAEHQGAILFGPAISPVILEGERAVQYFRNGRLDWYPELPQGSRALPGQLGAAHFADKMAVVLPDIRDNIVVPAVNVTAVDVYASVRAPVLYSGDEQTLTIKIINQDGGESVSDLRVEAVMRFGAEERLLDLGVTQEESWVHAPLDMTDVPPGVQVDLEINVYAPGDRLVGADTVSFQTWW